MILQSEIQIRVFQLGHVFSDMDRILIRPSPFLTRNVSIGPRLFRHG